MRIPIPPAELKRRLVTDGVLSDDAFEQYVGVADRKAQSLLDVLVSEAHVDQGYLQDTIASILGVKLARIDAAIDETLVKLLPEAIARQRGAVLFKREPDGSIGVAMLNPSDLDTLAFLRQYLGRSVTPYLATAEELNRAYQVYGLQSATDFTRVIQENVTKSLASAAASTPEEAAAQLPIVAIVDSLVSYASTSGASDIHVEALEDATLIRYRVDGMLREIMRVPIGVHAAITARLKLLAGLKIDEHYRPQDGRFRYQMVNANVDCRVSVLPTYYGEKVVIRLLSATDKPLSLQELGMFGKEVEMVTSAIEKSYGMVLVTGPTGSGKSTTLYALMEMLNQPDVNMVTVEDPVEYNMRYVNQSQINPAAGVTFASGIRAILRQDPDIIMVGEIRDAETADVSVQAALTGHLVLTTLHTNDAPTAIPRLIDLNVPPFLVASVVNAIIAQRLVRRICPQCISSFTPDAPVLDAIADQYVSIDVPEADRRIPKTLYRGKGCPNCHGSGYRGRLGIYEILDIDDTIRNMIGSKNFEVQEFREAARAAGMRSMYEDGIEKAEQALTTVEEVLRVIRE